MKKYLKKSPEYLIYLLVFLLPFSTRYIFENTAYSLYGLDILFLAILIAFFSATPKASQESKNNNLLILLGFFWVVNFFNLYWSGDKNLSGYYLLRLTEALLLAYMVLRTKLDFKKLAWAWVGAGAIQSLLGIVQFWTQKTWACKWLGMAEHLPETLGTQVVAGDFGRVLRAYGTFPHPNILGMFLLIAIFLAIYLYLIEERRINHHLRERYALLICLIILTTGFFLTFSRQAWLGLCFGLLLLLVLYRPRKIVTKLIGAIFIKIIILSLIYPQIMMTRFDLDQSLELYSVEQRMEQQVEAGTIISKYWPIGIGLGTYTKHFTEPVHNIYVLILAELGIFGLLSFLMILGYFIYRWIKDLYEKLELKKIIIGISLLMLLFIGLFDHYLWTTFPFILIFYLILSLDK